MTAYGISLVKNEADIIRPIIEHMLTQLDQVIVADNGSTDGTREILDGLENEHFHQLAIYDDPDPAYFQSRKMSALARTALEYGAEFVVPFDADELWLTRSGQRIKDELKSLPVSVLVVESDLWDYVSTGQDSDDANPLKRIQWRRDRCVPLPKVACRAREGMRIEQGNHAVTYPDNPFPGTVKNLLTIRHFPYRSVDQFIGKIRTGAAAYKATDLPESMGAHWRQWGAILESQGERAVAEIYRKWFFRERPYEPIYIDGEIQPPLVHDPMVLK